MRVRLRVRDDLPTTAVHVRALVDGDPVFIPCRREAAGAGDTWWEAALSMTNPRLSYRFLLTTGRDAVWVNGAGVHRREVSDVHDFRLTSDTPPPAWVGDAVFYEVFLDRFARGGHSARPDDVAAADWALPADWADPVIHRHPDAVRQFYGGDLAGVAENLDHLQTLGVTALYLTPFFPARSHHRYDAISFDHVDPLLGGDQALAHLLEQAHAREFHVIGDLTLNHTGSGHDWFRRARTDPDSDEAGFYLFTDHPDSYVSFAADPRLPKLDHRSGDLRRRLFDGHGSVMATYLRDHGLDGWRIDVAQSAGYSGPSDRTMTTARAARMTAEQAIPEPYLVAEHQFDASTSLVGDGWHGTMAYAAFTRPVWSWLADGGIDHLWGVPADHCQYSGHDLADTITEFTALVPWRSRVHSLNLLDSHDTPRLRSIVGPHRSAVATGMLLTFPGIPMIFAGDEIGTAGDDMEQARQPFRWDASTWDDVTLQRHRRLIALRRDHPALTGGGFRWLHVGTDCVVYERAHPTETLIIQAGRAAHRPVWCPAGAEDLLGDLDIPDSGGYLPADGPRVGVWKAQRPMVRGW